MYAVRAIRQTVPPFISTYSLSFCSISEPSFFQIAAIFFGEKACRHVNVCPGIMIFNKSYIVLNKYKGLLTQARIILKTLSKVSLSNKDFLLSIVL